MINRSAALPIPPICPYCRVPARLEPASVVYGPNWTHKWLWVCGRFPSRCDAFVGCHPGSKVPLGVPADKALRDARVRAHGAFDALWRRERPAMHGELGVLHAKPISRGYAYHLLAGYLKIKVHQTHIGMFDLARCARVLDFAKAVQEGSYPQRSAT